MTGVKPTCSHLTKAPPRQLLVDVSTLARVDDKSGIQRVVWNVLRCLLRNPPSAYRVRPIYRQGSRYWYANRFVQTHFHNESGATDTRVQFGPQDIFLGLDLDDKLNRGAVRFLRARQQKGVKLYFIVHDLLPIVHPEWFVQGHASVLGKWFARIVSLADGLVCVSKTVSTDIVSWLDEHQNVRNRKLSVGYSHNGADFLFDGHGHITKEERMLVQWFAGKTVVLMVGTLDPRKGHQQALDAMEVLWEKGQDILLVIVGKQGWKVEQLVQRLHSHVEDGNRLFWFAKAGDGFLHHLYRVATVLLMASQGEGFGLPLIEAAQHDLPVIARDLPVFREIAGDNVFYFRGNDGKRLARALETWMDLFQRRQHPASGSMRWLSWEESTENLLRLIIGQQWQLAWSPKKNR